jgi:uncharacterized protein (TIGR02145 family)
MKKHILIRTWQILFVLSVSLSGCSTAETFEKATVVTNEISDITEVTAVCSGLITSDGGDKVTSRGICWSTAPDPNSEDDNTLELIDSLSFECKLKGLTPGTVYYTRAFATNRGGTSYGEQKIFTTKTLTLMTLSPSFVLATSAISGGYLLSNADSGSILARGVCWGTFPYPTIADSLTTNGNGNGAFTSVVTGLKPSTTYFIRAYVTNANGTTYGNIQNFTTQNGIIGINSLAATSITTNAALLGGFISGDGGSAITDRGFCWNTVANPTIDLTTKVSLGSIMGSYTFLLTDLLPGGTYHVRAYAKNEVGITYGEDITFKTNALLPIVSTAAVTDITTSTAVSGGDITYDGGSSILDRGVCWSLSTNPTIDQNPKSVDGAGTGPFISTLSGLTSGRTYYVRAYATNSVGTVYGANRSFRVLALPEVLTTAISSLGNGTATSGGNATWDGGMPILSKGICWNTTGSPTVETSTKMENGSGTGSYSCNMTGLSYATTYYVRAYATNELGTGYGAQVSFKSKDFVTDVDGNTYSTVVIGTQTWMAENLRTTKYRDGSSIPVVTDSTSWKSLSTGACCNYKNSASNGAVYGLLYNWLAVNDSRKIAPAGWHVPTDNEFSILVNYLGGADLAGESLKETGTLHWESPNPYASNQSGFTALPAGYRNVAAEYLQLKLNTYFWSSTPNTSTAAQYLGIDQGTTTIYRNGWNVKAGLSVRCIKD